MTTDMTEKEFEELEHQANNELREFKRNLKAKFPHLYKAIKQYEKENDEKGILMIDLFLSRFAGQGITMTDPYDVYNAVVDIMCSHCNNSVRNKCRDLPEDTRCKTKIHCMKRILKRDDEEYPTRLPKVK